MTKVGAFEAKTHLSALLEKVARGEEITITRHGKAIARLVPFEQAAHADMDETISALRKNRAGATLGGLSWKELRDKGRA